MNFAQYSLVPGLGAIALVALGVAGCSSSQSAEAESTTRREGPLYVVSNTLLVPDSVTSYVTVVDSLEAGADVDPAKYLELPGSARAYGPEGADVVYTTSSEAPTITEIAFGPSGAAKKGRTLSFAKLGIDGTSGGNVILHISPTKAYFVSQDSLEIVVWNPAEMTITKTVPLNLELDPAFPYPYFYPRPIVVGDKLVLVSNNSGEDDLGPGVIVTVVNTVDDSIESSTAEPRCHSLLQSAVNAKGDRYFASSDFAAATHLVTPEVVPEPCMLRMREGETSFDPDWSRTLTPDLATGIWTGVTQGANGSIYVQATADDTDAVAAAAKEGAYDVTIAQPWDWYALEDGDAEPMPAETGLTSPPAFAPIPVDGNDYVSVWDEVDTTLVNLTASKKPRPGLVVSGFVYNVVRIR